MLFCLAIGIFILSPLLASAQSIGPTIPEPEDIFSGGLENVGKNVDSPQKIVALVFQTVIALSGAVFLVLFLFGGVRYLFGSGDEEATGKAKKVLIDSIIGLLIVLAAWGIGTWILGKLGLGPETEVQLATPTTPLPGGTTGGGTGGTTGPGGTGMTNQDKAENKGYADGSKDGAAGRAKNTSRNNYQTRVEIDAYNKGYNEGYDKYYNPGVFRPQKPTGDNYEKMAPIGFPTYQLLQSETRDKIKKFYEDCSLLAGKVKVDEGWMVTRFYCRGSNITTTN